MPTVPKWARFETGFKSSIRYSNALQDVTFSVRFISPLGETNLVYGFWDGGNVWRVRFSPDKPGLWTYTTVCSDTANKGLHNRSGQFLCTAIIGQTRFNLHGPIGVARDHRHFEHLDGTPFFWVADTAWAGARMSDAKGWLIYAQTRASQKFSAVEWAALPGPDSRKQGAFLGSDRVAINPDYFKRLDDRLQTLSRAGLLSAISVLSPPDARSDGASRLPDDQAAMLVRYAMARWGADPVAWIVPVGKDDPARDVERWKRIGPSIFTNSHAPVIVYTTGERKMTDPFQGQDWVDGFAFRFLNGVTDQELKSALAESDAKGAGREARRVLIPVAPRENRTAAQGAKRVSGDDVRHCFYWSLLMTGCAGIDYEAEGVVQWNTATGARSQNSPEYPLWQKSLFLPGAKQVGALNRFINSIEFWRLRSEPGYVANQPGLQMPGHFIAAAGTEAKDLAVAYSPEERTLEILLDALPASPTVNWFNPRTGEGTPAVAVVGGRTCQFPTPDPGDWVLVMKAGK